jgi:Flp pilus assembly protein TadD
MTLLQNVSIAAEYELTCYLGSTCELQSDSDGALFAYEQALRHNCQSIQALNAISCILRTKENFPRAVEYLQTILKLDQSNGEVWGSLGSYIYMSLVNAFS